MKIAFLINSLGKGGAEHVAVNLMRHYKNQGYNILLVTSRENEEEYELDFKATRYLVEEDIKAAKGGRIGRIFARARRLEEIWIKEQPNLILSFIGKMNIYGCLSTRRYHIPVIVNVRSDPRKEYPSIFDRIMAKYLFRHEAIAVFTQTEQVQHFFGKKIENKCFVMPNILDESFFRPPFHGEREKEVVMVGRHDENKNHAMVIRAMSKLLPEYSDYRLVFYGDELVGGEGTTDKLKALTKELGMEHCVIFAGRQKNIREKIERAQIFVLASGYEGMPNALLEAMSTGLCCISTDCPCGGPASIIKSGKNGFLIPVNDEKALVDTLKKVMDDGILREKIGDEAAKISAKLNPSLVCRKWQDTISEQYGKYINS